MALKLSENSLRVLEKRYLKKDENGKVIETPQEMFSRVARTVAEADRIFAKSEEDIGRLEKKFYDMMSGLEFMPNSPTLMNAGRELSQLSACFVLPIADSMESIFDSIKATALIHKSGGGTGFSFSRLRPRSSTVKSTGGIASGPISFMKVFDAATNAVKQGGTRRGANMGILRVDHPDILDFISCKEGDKDITNFNISVAVTEDFMRRALKNEEYELVAPHTGQVVKKLNAKTVFEQMVKMAHKNGEPGIIFIDRVNNANPTPKLGKIESTNPCGEQPLLPYESCNLGSINIYALLNRSGDGFVIDWPRLAEVTRLAVHFLDNVIEVNKFPLPEIEKMTRMTRKVGLGVMGWASALAKMMIPYDSEEAIQLAEKLMAFILTEARKESVALAKDRGVFAAFQDSVYDKEGGLRLRNATLTTIAPTGTISIIAGPCSSGIEPIFAISYQRANVLDNDKMIEVEPAFREAMEARGLYSRKLMEEIAERGSIREMGQVPEDIRRVFVTAHDITPEWHIRMQAAFQKCTDNAVSKTVNFHNDATVDEVRQVYLLAYDLGCKGVTIYRDKSREEQVLNIGTKDPAKQDNLAAAQAMGKIGPRPRPEVVTGTTTKVSTGCGNLYVTINTDESNRPFEVFTSMGKAGGCAMSQLEAIGRLVSLAFRSGVDVKVIVEQLRSIRCPSPSWEKGSRIFSCADAIARVIERRLVQAKAENKVPTEVVAAKEELLSQVSRSEEQLEDHLTGNIVGVCPDCGGVVRHEEGCVKCSACGYTKC